MLKKKYKFFFQLLLNFLNLLILLIYNQYTIKKRNKKYSKDMNKADLINSISEKTGLTKTKSNQVLNALTEAITESLSNGNKVTLVGFGTFTVSDRNPRKGRNPKTGELIDIPAKRVARFRPGTSLNNELN